MLNNKFMSNYEEEYLNYIIFAQKIFSCMLFLFYSIYNILINILDLLKFNKLNPTFKFAIIQNVFFISMFFLFNNFFKKNKKYSLFFAYTNIILTILSLEYVYFTYTDYISYTIIICIILSTAFTIIDSRPFYFLIITFIFILDTLLLTKNDLNYYFLITCFIDNIIIILFCISLNTYVSKMKLKDFTIKSELKYTSSIDPLTKLLNRHHAKLYINNFSNTNIYAAMIILDLDNFKYTNDILGHMKGDEVLIEFSQKIKSIFNDTTCVSRLGGDEFLIFIPNIKKEENIKYKINQILNIFPLECLKENPEITVSCSIGVIFANCNITNLYNTLYKLSDQAMYEAKNNGKNKIVIKELN